MKFSVIITALTAAAVNAATVGKRQSNACAGAAFAIGVYERPWVGPVFEECQKALVSAESRLNPWVNKACVAAAVLVGMPDFHDALECAPPDSTDGYAIVLPDYSTWPSLDYGVYASIVGDCAYAEGGCPITMQNFVDLIYSTISKESPDAPVYPDIDTLKKYYLTPRFTWANFSVDAGIPYVNFNDWLHYSDQVDNCTPYSGCASS